MLGPQDLKGIAQLIDPENESQIQNIEEEVDISHLDYQYVATCNNRNELGTLLNYLRSGKEGYYPELEEAIMKRMETLDPTIRLLPISDKEKYEAKQEVDRELDVILSITKEWVNEVTAAESNSTLQKPMELDQFPQSKGKKSSFIRFTAEAKSIEHKPTKPATSRIKSTDYRSWDKLDVEKELELIEKGEQKETNQPTIINSSEPVVNVPEGLSDIERKTFALNEKNKGNECMKAKEYDQAYLYYTTSIKLDPTVAVYNNRALTHLKLKNYSRAKEDSLEALQILKNFKSYLRVSLAEYHLGQYQEAMRDIDLALEIEDKNKEALDLRKQIMEKWKDVDGVAVKEKISKSKKKLSILEIEDFPPEQSDSKNSEKERQIDYNFTNDPRIPKIVELEEEEDVQIVDVDDDSSDDEMPDQKSKVLYANEDSDDEDE